MEISRREIAAGLLAGMAFGFSSVPAVSKNGIRSNRRTQPNRTRASRLIKQSDKRSGHFSRRHVAKPISYLRARAVTRKARADFRGAAKKPKANTASRSRVAKHMKRVPKRQKRAEFSTFSDVRIAQASLARALTRNDKTIRAWIRSGRRKTLTIQTTVPGSAGAVYLPGSGRVVQPKKAIFVLKRDGRAFRLHTGYLTSNGVGKL